MQEQGDDRSQDQEPKPASIIPEDVPFELFVMLWNMMQGLGTPALHVRMARWLGAQWGVDYRLLLMAFRSSGKSTIVGLFCAWLLWSNPNLRILVLAAETELARKMVRNVKHLIERHPLTGGLRPERPDQWGAEGFTVRRGLELRDPSMLARGVTANITGSRADVIICDDVEVPNTCDTGSKRQELRERLAEAAFILVPGGTQLYVGTPHTHDSIYRQDGIDGKAPFLGDFQRLEIPIVTQAGHSQWPERFTEAAIDRLRRFAGPNKFRSQMMLEPVDLSEVRLDPDKMRIYETDIDWRQAHGRPVLTLEGVRLLSASCWWDPAFASGSASGDGSVIAAVFSDEDGGYWLHGVEYLSSLPGQAEDEATQQCRQVVAFVRRQGVPSITIETNGIGRFLPGLLRKVLRQERVSCAVIEAHSTRPKVLRITEAFDAVLAAGALHVHKEVTATPLIAEMRDWRPGGGGHDDGLDAVAGALLSEPVRIGSSFASNK